jgi:hypothetical protein
VKESVVVILKFFISPSRLWITKNPVMELVECNDMGIMTIRMQGSENN